MNVRMWPDGCNGQKERAVLKIANGIIQKTICLLGHDICAIFSLIAPGRLLVALECAIKIFIRERV